MVVPEPKQNFSDNHDNNNNNNIYDMMWLAITSNIGRHVAAEQRYRNTINNTMANATRISIGLHMLRNCANT
jgi:hypothetical protein